MGMTRGTPADNLLLYQRTIRGAEALPADGTSARPRFEPHPAPGFGRFHGAARSRQLVSQSIEGIHQPHAGNCEFTMSSLLD